jgi:hypothetical protein
MFKGVLTMNAITQDTIQEALKREDEYLRRSQLFLNGTIDFESTLRIHRGVTMMWPPEGEAMDLVRLDSMTLKPTPIELTALRAFAEVRAFNFWADLYQLDPTGYRVSVLGLRFIGADLFRRTIVLRKRYPALGGWVWRDHRDWHWVPEPGQRSFSLMELYTTIFHVQDVLISPDQVFKDRVTLWEKEFPESYAAIMAAGPDELIK